MRCLVVALILVMTRWSTAEINMADSIEWTTADSDLVVVARVARLTERKGPGQTTWFRVTFAVSETLKGPAAKTVDVMVRHLTGDSPAKWKAGNTELLLFLVHGKRRAIRDGECREGEACSSEYTTAPLAIRGGRWGEGDAYKLDGSARGYTITHDVISKRADLIAKVRATAGSKATQAFQLDLPLNSPAGRALWGGSAVFLYVPIDAALEQYAIKWLSSTSADERDRGVEVLAHFKSTPNIARLENMLGDVGTHDVTLERDKPVRRFFVRKRAHEVLRAWGVPHTTPPIDTVAPRP